MGNMDVACGHVRVAEVVDGLVAVGTPCAPASTASGPVDR